MRKTEQKTESVKEYITRRKEEETKGFSKMDSKQKEEAFVTEYTLADVEEKLKGSQREILDEMISDAEKLDKAVEERRSYEKDKYWDRISTMLDAYKIIFGYHEHRKITNTDDLDYAGMDLEAAKKIKEELK